MTTHPSHPRPSDPIVGQSSPDAALDGGPSPERSRLVDQLISALNRRSASQKDATPPLISLSIELPAWSPLEWLAAHDTEPGLSFYWNTRDRSHEIAARWSVPGGDPARDDLPSSWPHRETEQVLAEAIALPADGEAESLCAIAVLPFDSSSPSGTRRHGGGAPTCSIPDASLTRHGDRTVLTVIRRPDPRPAMNLEGIIDELIGQVASHAGLAGTLHDATPVRFETECSSPDRAEWDAMIARARSRIADGTIDKVVLSRRRRLPYEGSLNPWRLARALADREHDAFVYLARRRDRATATTFLGASPELLFRRVGDSLSSECIAGTRPRGASPESDRQLGIELLRSAKERAEHSYVIEGVTESLRSISLTVTAGGEPRVLKLPAVQHLVTGVEARLRDRVTIGQALDVIHPTPAVGGLPRAAALDLIRELEPADRGWYAGPIGWFSRDVAEFAVAIRSVLIEQQDTSRSGVATLFAGAGIVADSDPAAEWHETADKSDALRDLLLAVGES